MHHHAGFCFNASAREKGNGKAADAATGGGNSQQSSLLLGDAGERRGGLNGARYNSQNSVESKSSALGSTIKRGLRGVEGAVGDDDILSGSKDDDRKNPDQYIYDTLPLRKSSFV